MNISSQNTMLKRLSAQNTYENFRSNHTNSVSFKNGLSSDVVDFKSCKVNNISFTGKTIEGIKKVAVIGAGTMGSGIASVLLANGLDVQLVDTFPGSTERGKATIGKNLDRSYKKAVEAAQKDGKPVALEAPEVLMQNLSTSGNLADIQDADLIIEAVFEKEDVKNNVLSQIDKYAKPGAIIATNTSSISITKLAKACPEHELIGMHFFNPVPAMKLVEVIKGDNTSAEAVEKGAKFAVGIGKTPITVKDSPGFVVNRLLVPMLNEAANLVAEGVASAKDIDTAMKLGAGHPMGPLELTDVIGVDVTRDIMDVLKKNLGDKYNPAPVYSQLIDQGNLGRKSKTGGFYTYGTDGKISGINATA